MSHEDFIDYIMKMNKIQLREFHVIIKKNI